MSTPNAPATAPGDRSTSGDGSQAGIGKPGVTQRATFVPTRVVVGKRSTSIEEIDTASTGELGLPKSAAVVGWWRSGALAGDAYGTVVLAGHIDSAVTGVGFFSELLTMRKGARVDLQGAGYTQSYRVTSVQDIPKASLAADRQIFSSVSPERLLLITCTGKFNYQTRHYDHNRLVFAEPLGRATGGP